MHPEGKLTDFIGNLQCWSLKAFPRESVEFSDHSVKRGFLDGIDNNQVTPDLKKSVVDAALGIRGVLEKAIHLQATTRFEEDKKKQRLSCSTLKSKTLD